MSVPERPIHLDALVARAVFDQAREDGASLEEAISASRRLPLAKTVTAEVSDWVWAASQLALTAADMPFSVPFVRNTNLMHLAADRAAGVLSTNKDSFPEGTGPFRLYFFQQPFQYFSTAEAFGIGEIDEVRSLLSKLPALGKLRRNGAGVIRSLTVESISAEACTWNYRSLPLALQALATDRHFPSTGTLHPPYWDRTRWQEILAFA